MLLSKSNQFPIQTPKNDSFETSIVTIDDPSDSPLKLQNKIISKLISDKNTEIIDNLFYVKDVGFNYWTKGRGKKRSGLSIGKRVLYGGIRENKNDIPFIKGRNVHRYCNDLPDHYLRHNYNVFLDDKIDTFRFSENFLTISPKIIYRQTANRIIATIDDNSHYLDKTVHLIVPKSNGNKIEVNYLLGLLNSELFNYLYKYISQETIGRAFAQVKTTYVKKLPIMLIKSDIQSKIVASVNQILTAKKANPQADTTTLEAEIDRLVYELYGLTEDEIAIVEESTQ